MSIKIRSTMTYKINSNAGICGTIEKEDLGKYTFKVNLEKTCFNMKSMAIDSRLTSRELEKIIEELVQIKDFIVTCNITDKVESN